MSRATPSAETILAQAVAIADPAERAAFLDRACGNEVALRERLGRLADHHLRAGSFLVHPPAVAFPDETAPFEPSGEEVAVGTRVGPYALRERLGEGGMGAVWVAEQAHPVRRRVAVKLIKPGMDTRHVVARFEAERQALALMDHPNIAKVLDAGAAPGGRPYFAMELVRGVPITDYCDAHRLPVRDRLGLVSQVCAAVQHAHQKGVIHRDLKPSNVLVSVHDVAPVVKVIDFGIAKAVGQSLTDKTVYTGHLQLVGTPLYMALEQAGLSDLDVDTRADVYALGVLLYELLTGGPPFGRDRLAAAGLDEFRRVVREEEPARPSGRVSTLAGEARSTVAAARRADPRRLAVELRGELDWVVMKCLEKDRDRRYESAAALAADLRRFLADEPVAARPPSAAYRLRKFARRHRVGLAAAGVVAAAMAALAGGLGYVLSDRAARLTAVGRTASEALAGARAAVEAGDLDIAAQRVAEAGGHLGADARHLPAEATEIDQLRQEVADRKADQDHFHRFLRLTADAQDKMGYGSNLGGERVAEEALGLFGVLTDDGRLARLDGSYLTPGQREQVREAAYVTLVSLADFLVRWEVATKHPQARRGLDLLARAEALHPPTRAFYFVRSVCHRRLGDRAAADEDRQRQRLAPAASAWDHYLPGHTAGWEGDVDEAIRGYRAALAVQPDHYNSLFFLASRLYAVKKEYREAVGLFTGCIALRPGHEWGWMHRAGCYELMGNFTAAESDYTAGVRQAMTDPQRRRALEFRAHFFEQRGNRPAAEEDFAAAIRAAATDPERVASHLARARYFVRHGDPEHALEDFAAAAGRAATHDELFLALSARACVWRAQGQPGKADTDVRRLVEDVTRLVEATPDAPQRAALLHRRADYHGWLGRSDRAVADYTAAVGLDPRSADHWGALAVAQVVSADPAGARGSARRALELGPDDREGEGTQALVLLLAGGDDGYRQACQRIRGRSGESKAPRAAYRIARTCTHAPGAVADAAGLVAIARRAVEATQQDRDCNLHALGMALYRAGRFEEARARFREVEERYPEWDGRVCNWLALSLVHHRLGDAAEAGRWHDKAVSWLAAPSAREPWVTPIGPSLEVHVHNWLAYRALLREVEALRVGPPPKRSTAVAAPARRPTVF